MRKIYLEIMVMVFFNEANTEEKITKVLEDADYNFNSGEGFDVVNTEMEEIETGTFPRPTQSLVHFMVVINTDVEVEEFVKNVDYDITHADIEKTEIREFEVIDSK